MIILDSTENEVDVEEYYHNLYITQLILVEPERVVSVLEDSFAKGKAQMIKYDLQEALKVSLQIETYSNKNKVETYLYEKLGEVEKCITSYLKILESYFWQYIDVYESIEEKKDPNDSHSMGANNGDKD